MKIKNLAKDFFTYAFSNVLIRLVALLSLPVISRAFSISDFGVIETVGSIVALFPTIIGLGYDVAILKELLLEEDLGRKKSISASTFRFLACWGGLVTIILLIFSDLLSKAVLGDQGYGVIWRIACVNIYINVFFSYNLQLFRAQFEAKQYTIFNGLHGVFQYFAIIVAVVFFNGSIKEYFLVSLANSALWTSVLLVLNRSYYSGEFDWEIVKKILRIGIPVMVSSLAYWVFNLSDRIVLSALCSLTQTGYYSMANKIVNLLPMLVTVFGHAWIPRAFELYKNSPEKYIVVSEKAHVLFAVVFSVIVLANIAGAKLMIIVFSTRKYIPCLITIVPLALSCLFEGLSKITCVGIYLNDKTKDIALAAWISALINLTVNLLFMKKYGAVVGGISTMISYLFLYVFYYYRSCKYLGTPFNMGRPAIVIVFATITAIAINFVSVANDLLDCAAKLGIVVVFVAVLIMTKILDIKTVYKWMDTKSV